MFFSEFKAAADLLKDAITLVQKAQNYDPELLGKLRDIQGQILDFQQRVLALSIENEELKRQLANRDMVFDNDLGAYYAPEDVGKKAPFCQRCLDADNKHCRLQLDNLEYRCSVCNTKFQTQAQKEALRARISAQREKIKTLSRIMSPTPFYQIPEKTSSAGPP